MWLVEANGQKKWSCGLCGKLLQKLKCITGVLDVRQGAFWLISDVNRADQISMQSTIVIETNLWKKKMETALEKKTTIFVMHLWVMKCVCRME